MANKTLYVTIDTEMDADIHWKKGKPTSFSSVLEGIPKTLRPIWDEYKICPIYFVSPEVVMDVECCKVLKSEIAKGAVIGAHLHPEYIEPQMDEIGRVEIESFPCYGYDTEIERAKIINLKNLIRKKLGVEVIWYRAARFGADEDTFKILDELGFKYDSSITPCIDWSQKGGPNHSKTGIRDFKIEGTNIREYPVTIYSKRFGALGKILPENWLFYSWLRPTHMTYIEEKRFINWLDKNGIDNIVMMFHSMEIMINKTPYVRNRWMQDYYIWRLRKTVSYAIKKGYSSYKLEEN